MKNHPLAGTAELMGRRLATSPNAPRVAQLRGVQRASRQSDGSRSTSLAQKPCVKSSERVLSFIVAGCDSSAVVNAWIRNSLWAGQGWDHRSSWGEPSHCKKSFCPGQRRCCSQWRETRKTASGLGLSPSLSSTIATPHGRVNHRFARHSVSCLRRLAHRTHARSRNCLGDLDGTQLHQPLPLLIDRIFNQPGDNGLDAPGKCPGL